MMKFEITYELKGTRKVIATVPDSFELPLDWADWVENDKDEWIYNRQSAGEIVFEDIHHAQAQSVEWAD
jgi:hypothetical protein